MKAKVKLNKYKNNIIKISGSKNSSLPIIAASILCDEQVTINNIPNISDIVILVNIIKKMGYNISFSNNTIITTPTFISKKRFHFHNINKIRGSYYLIGSLIGKYNYSDFSFNFPGGCNFNDRPINYHLNAFNNMGLTCFAKGNKLYFKGYRHNNIHNLVYPSVGATINIILASCKINKKTIIKNASIEPEVIDLCNFINSMGAHISIENRTITIEGVEYMRSTNYTIMCDRIEAATFLTIGALHNGITITNIDNNSLNPIINLFEEIGYSFDIKDNYITLHTNNSIKPFNITLDPHPGLPTDIGPILCVLASQIPGSSCIVDNVYPSRISHIKELQKFNIDISLNSSNHIIINGKTTICNKKVKAHDLRCGAALIVCASLCSNYSYIYNIEKVFRGYENIKCKLYNLGINFI